MFNSAKLKVEWAELHIDKFIREFGVFGQHNCHGFSVAEELEGGKHRVNVNMGHQPPINFALIIADVIHNLRTALDHANWELRGLDGGTQDAHTALPIREKRVDYEGICGGIKTPTGDLPDFFKALEFFKGGKGHLIWALHDLDVVDKHMFLHVVISSLVVTMPQGKSTVHITTPAVRLNPSMPPPLKIDKDTNAALDICFGNVEGFKFQSVVPTLLHLTDAVKQVIGQFEALVAARE